MAAISTGTSCVFGIGDDSIGELFVQGYSVNSTFNLSGLVAGEDGKTKTARYDDRKTEMTIDGICITSGMPVLGAALNFTVNVDTAYSTGAASESFSGTITSISQKGSNKDFTSVSITAVSYEDVPAEAPSEYLTQPQAGA
jgi:hypothetical protein